MKVFLVPNLNKQQRAVQAAQHAADILQHNGAQVFLQDSLQALCVVEGAIYAPRAYCERCADIVLTIGGDGTILHEASHALYHKKPILGINLGRKGFLAVCEEYELEQKLTLLTQNLFRLDPRAMLYAKIQSDGIRQDVYALNDIVVAKGVIQQAVEFNVFCDGTPVERYRGDGVVVATPTGSTAYSLAAGGPVLDARIRAMVLTPISPHSLHSPAMVFAPERRLEIRLGRLETDETVYVSCDGAPGQALAEGAVVTISLSEKTISLVTFDGEDQFHAIDQKLKYRN